MSLTDCIGHWLFSRTIVSHDLVPGHKLIEGDAVTMRCAHGDTVLYPVAQLELQVVEHQCVLRQQYPSRCRYKFCTDVPELH